MITSYFRRHPRPRGTAASVRYRFRTWRGERPFWAGLFTLLAGLPILYWPYAHLDLGGIPLALSTTSGAGSLIIGTLLITLGLTLWYRGHLRMFAGIATLLLTLVSFPVANFGGLFLGLACGLLGGALACSWIPPDTTESPAAHTQQTATTTATTTVPTATATTNSTSEAVPTGDSRRGN
ncbi:DUF6114 domain-containing protein [Streptomyces sp. NPDC006012]|uniref:DUF6114 domain-containing protein n=1 Tax=Streptomyces sp. NPDC006012 TaxID=3364739 RepID=UPI0036B9BE18